RSLVLRPAQAALHARGHLAHPVLARTAQWRGRHRGVVQGQRPAPFPGAAGRRGTGPLPGAIPRRAGASLPDAGRRPGAAVPAQAVPGRPPGSRAGGAVQALTHQETCARAADAKVPGTTLPLISTSCLVPVAQACATPFFLPSPASAWQPATPTRA